MRIVAILAAYNEEKILARVIRWLADQGVETYLIDNESTDGTLAVLCRGYYGPSRTACRS